MIDKRTRTSVLAVLAAAPLTLAACGGSQPSGSASSDPGGGSLTVFAAASLTESFTTIGSAFEAKNAGTKVTFSFGSSATLATQITQGAPADVFAAASDATMKTVTDAGAATAPVPFVSNTLEIAVPPKNPGRITGLTDFGNASLKLALCAPEVPCGAAAIKIFAAAKITPKPDTLEADVKAVLQKVEIGEVDAALVYETDVLSAGSRVRGIQFPEARLAVNTYPIAALKSARNPALAQSFVDFVLSPDGRAVLSKAGFGKP